MVDVDNSKQIDTLKSLNSINLKHDDLDESILSEMAVVTEALSITLDQAKEIAHSFDVEIQQAIEQRSAGIDFKKSPNVSDNSIAAIDACSSAFPRGTETGFVFSIDFGGSNLRAVAIELLGNGNSKVTEKKSNLRVPLPDRPKGLLDKNTTASQLFDTIADTVRLLVEEVGENTQASHNLAFTFSFPIKQNSIESGTLITWTKEFETGCSTNDPVVGQDVGMLMNQAFKRCGLPLTKVCCLINDTVGTMLSAGYTANVTTKGARVGVILGTGFNIAFMDKVAPELGYQGSIINLECGNFNKLSKIRTLVDEEVDFYSNCRGQQWAEKMISGLYIGELCRLFIVRVFQQRCTKGCFVRNCFDAADAAAIYNDKTKKYTITREILKKNFDWDMTDIQKLRVVYKIVCLVFNRSATLAAILTYVTCQRSKFVQRALGGCTVGIDGSLYILNPKYQTTYQKTVQRLLNLRADLVGFFIATDGSGKGAAIMAACEGNKTSENNLPL